MADTRSLLTERDATPADCAALARLGADSFVETFGHLYSAENLALFLENHSEPAWAKDLADPAIAIRVVEEGAQAVAYAKVTPPKLPFVPDPARKALELKQFYVLKPWHGAGLAPRLMDWVIATARARGADDLYLSVFTDNHRARRFYERAGFEEVGRWHFMVGDQADEDLVVRLRLTPA
jgi:ribosomal protein S18 acetylase RimI-like enzyme